ncbi:TPA: hypothetical protein ACOQ5R_005289 [Bacillus cereus]|nr:hypothetical protein [Bacillus cereus]
MNAKYCESCGVEIYCGDICNECERVNGSEQVVLTICIHREED